MITFADILAFEQTLKDQLSLTEQDRDEITVRCDQAMSVLQSIRHPDIPSAATLHLAPTAAQEVMVKTAPSPGLASPLIEEARKLNLYDDFKPLSDLALRPDLGEGHIPYWRDQFHASEPRNHGILIRSYIDATYQEETSTPTAIEQAAPPHLNSGVHAIDAAFAGTEACWERLVKEPAGITSGSSLPLPYPMLVPAGRFQESYYWDTAFGVYGLLATGRLTLAQMQADNFLEQIRLYGFIPNGTRDYYLSRSQPPLSSHMIRKVVEASSMDARLKKWLRERAVPLLAAEFLDFWSDPETRFDSATGLHHHWDALDVKRPERHGADNEAALGNTLRDVRAMAESGLDFTRAYQGPSARNEISAYASVLLNALLAGFAQDVTWLADLADMPTVTAQFNELASARKASIRAHLWDEARGYHRSPHLTTGTWNDCINFAIYAPLFAGIVTQDEADRIALAGKVLHQPYGIAASIDFASPHQWDGVNGWAPAQIMAVSGLSRYGKDSAAQDLAKRWVDGIAKSFTEHSVFYERLNVDSATPAAYKPHQYPVQEGFLWTNASVAWMALDVLALPILQHSTMTKTSAA